MAASSAPFAIGSSGLAANDAVYKVNIGRQWVINGASWRLLKAAANLAAPSNLIYVSALSGNAPTYVVNTTTTANDPTVVAFGTTGQVALAIGDYFLGQTSGYGVSIASAAIAAGDAVAPSTVAGRTVTATGLGGVAGIAIQAAAGAASLFGVRIIHLN